MKQFYTITEAAQALGLHHVTIRRLIKAGKLPAFQVANRAYRVLESDLYVYMQSVSTVKTVEYHNLKAALEKEESGLFEKKASQPNRLT